MKNYKNRTFPLSLETCDILDYVKVQKGISKKYLIERAIKHFVWQYNLMPEEQLDKLEQKYR